MEDEENIVPGDIIHHEPRRLRKPPPVTPKRFTRFFTPRSSVSRVSKPLSSKASRQLREITQSGINSRSHHVGRSRSPRKHVIFQDLDDLKDVSITPQMSSKKRKAYLSPESQPAYSSPCKRACSDQDHIPSSPPEVLLQPSPAKGSLPPNIPLDHSRIARMRIDGLDGRILQRSFGGLDIACRGRRKDNCTYWQAHASDFYTQPEEIHPFGSPALPYCAVACHTNSLVAIGDETGSIRLVETAKDDRIGFAQSHITFQPHGNAVMSMAFSSDDAMLATASGDQTSKVIDMHSQKTKYIMHVHTTSVKQICFQPGNDNVLVSSSRDGDIHIWDLRCKGSETVVTETAWPRLPTPTNELRTQYKAFAASPYGSIQQAHIASQSILADVPSAPGDNGAKDLPSTTTRNGVVSVTALAFLNAPGRSHLLVSGSEASTTLRLWDIRNRYSRRGAATPLSTTIEPDAHSRHRHFGITSLVQDSRGSRLYALSRDNTVYAYSVSHLINGCAPELESDFALRHHRSINDGRSGLGPLYGFRNPKLHATTFYIKAAMRQAKDKTELLAVGSADGCAVLFPTDESCFPKPQPVSTASGLSTPLCAPLSSTLEASARPALRRAVSSNFGLGARMRDTIPMHNVGTALIAGHAREVTDVTFTFDGDLVTLGDDYTARIWREGPQAGQMRSAKDGNAMRAGWGWAEVDSNLDEDDWE